MNAYELADELEQGAELEMELQRPENWADLTKASDMLRQQADRIAELQEFAIWMTGCGYDFTQHEYFNKCRDKLLVDIDTTPQTKPLSDEEIGEIIREHIYEKNLKVLCRAIEERHGIK